MGAQVTSIKDLMAYAEGNITELPPFAEGQPFVARLKRVSMIGLMTKGRIPNSLKVKANELFVSGQNALDIDNSEMLGELGEILEVFAEETLAEPTLAEIKEAGLELTDEQLMFLFQYAQKGVKKMESFRSE